MAESEDPKLTCFHGQSKLQPFTEQLSVKMALRLAEKHTTKDVMKEPQDA